MTPTNLSLPYFAVIYLVLKIDHVFILDYSISNLAQGCSQSNDRYKYVHWYVMIYGFLKKFTKCPTEEMKMRSLRKLELSVKEEPALGKWWWDGRN